MSLNARVVAIQGVGFSAIQLATQGLLDYIAGGGTTHRPRSTNTLRLQRIKDGKATALSAKALTHAHPATGRGARIAVEVVVVPGAVMCSHCRTTTKVRPVHAVGYASTSISGSTSSARGSVADSSGAAAAKCVRSRSATLGGRATVHAGGRATLSPFTSFSSHSSVRSRGVRNLSDAEVIAVVHVTIDNRR